ncbi:PREDICTED: recQ-mediated genome instability protein 2-like isoform X1 [Branchiostoma belcheri]|uniref:RecQ-mediated genome instability protein 2-like isoform X1 n=1 Tax=Branchiostoma belcheri TaxID=7741 RepID=A0A6P5AUU6_BRABE|nr:PREDICTED: recQ-mediated genome instability protein 2-like isoform X1 [Branchiostoma belcheri]KAI8508901.1 RecQ mediated genome instability 2 [Branchiostoma belcheri]
MGEKWKVPARKVFISQLAGGTQLPPATGSSVGAAGTTLWRVQLNPVSTKTWDVNLVWVQGTVVDCDVAGDWLTVDDGQGTAQVEQIKNIPKAKNKFDKGMYLMVVGYVLQCGSRPVLKAVKVQDLSDQVNHKVMWNLEVTDLQKC